MTDVSEHAAIRAGQRVGFEAKQKSQAFFESVWACGREATDADIYSFGGQRRQPLKLYRVAVRVGMKFLVIRCEMTKRFVTIIKDPKQ